MKPQVEYISKPSLSRFMSMWMRIGMVVTGILAAGILLLSGFAIDILADVIIPGLGEIILFVMLVMGAAIVGGGALLGMLIGGIHYSIVLSKYKRQEQENI